MFMDGWTDIERGERGRVREGLT